MMVYAECLFGGVSPTVTSGMRDTPAAIGGQIIAIGNRPPHRLAPAGQVAWFDEWRVRPNDLADRIGGGHHSRAATGHHLDRRHRA